MNGVINVYKESGLTSFNVVHQVKKILNIKKCGHIGTLDPIAEGVLPVCINHATKVSEYLMASDKEYIAMIRLGVKTDTMDISGKILENSEYIPGIEEVNGVVKEMIGEKEYKIPAFSAVKIAGERAYKLARKGLIDDAGSRTMTVYDISIIKYEYPQLLIKVSCEKGTYIRSLIDYLGDRLTCFGTMENLVRTKNGIFDIKNSFKLSQIADMVKNGDYEFVQQLNKVIDWPVCILKDEYVEKFLNGVQIPKNGYIKLPIEESDFFWISDINKKIIGFARKNKGKNIPLKVVKIFKDMEFFQ
ncbi:MAG: tRNA pseudouridine55 synthase [Deferribacteres bacterium]|jgi:tRNA pseudouridine55 synthase|nr:tRNA pseudouridine synthase [Deferribacteraceae bacterium]MDK2792451.1 tRNA pseudouridine55 synthase [Deferribacteres bacterium]